MIKWSTNLAKSKNLFNVIWLNVTLYEWDIKLRKFMQDINYPE